MKHFQFKLALIVLLAFSPAEITWADGQAKTLPEDLTELSLEALMGITVTSVSKKEETLMEAASAIYVITQEDLRRSGATSIPEALRMVPGMQVVPSVAGSRPPMATTRVSHVCVLDKIGARPSD